MFRLSLVVIIICLFFPSAVQLPSTGAWRGLIPLKSTRADVERLLGPSEVRRDKRATTYYLADVVVLINFFGNPQCKEPLTYDTWDAAPETITGLAVMLKRPVPMSNAGIDLTKFKKVHGDFDTADHFYYSHLEDGFSIEVGQNYIKGYIYSPGPKHKDLLCPAK